MSGPYKLSPFNELQFEINADTGAFTLHTYWSKVSGKIHSPEDINVLTKLQNKENHIEIDHARIQWLLQQFPTHGFSYILPRKILFSCFHRKYKDPKLDENIFASPKALYQEICKANNIEATLIDSFPLLWSWNIDDILTKAQINNTRLYDPNTIFSYTMKERYLADLKSIEGKKFFQALESFAKTDEQRALDGVKLYFMQVHYVTSHSTASLQNAVNLFSPLSKDIDDFVRSEKGHDKLIYQSLKGMGASDISQYRYLPSVQALMANLKFCSKQSLLGFLFLVDHFERDSHVKHHPVSDILKNTSKPEAASGFIKHRKINNLEEHEMISLKMIHKIPLIDQVSARQAVRLFEVQCILQDLINKELYASTKTSHSQ